MSSYGIYQSITHWFFRNHAQLVLLEGRERVDKMVARMTAVVPRLNLSEVMAAGEWQPNVLLSNTV